MIVTILVALAAATVAFLGGALLGGLGTLEKLADAQSERDEFKRRLNRILETDHGHALPSSVRAQIYALARGETI